jgi:hypothetical protein
LHSEEFHNFSSSADLILMIKSGRISWTEHVAHMGKKKNAYRVLVGNPHGGIPIGRPRWK